MNRYARHLALPEITPAQQQSLQQKRLLMVGAGGLGAAALPYLAGAGIGHIAIIDHDTVNITNLHRQTVYRSDQAGQPKAALMAGYLQGLNPEIAVDYSIEKLVPDNAPQRCGGYDLLLDGTDNFAAKTLLNTAALQTATPLVSASIDRFQGQAGIFAGFADDAPCAACLFDAPPLAAGNCNDRGVLNTAAGLTGLYQAHLALGFLLDLEGFVPGTFLSMDYKLLRLRRLTLRKNPDCRACGPDVAAEAPIALLPPQQLQGAHVLIVDVRSHAEIAADPIARSHHIPLQDLPLRIKELPKDKTLAFACASNVRSTQAAHYARAMGYRNVCVLDRLAG